MPSAGRHSPTNTSNCSPCAAVKKATLPSVCVQVGGVERETASTIVCGCGYHPLAFAATSQMSLTLPCANVSPPMSLPCANLSPPMSLPCSNVSLPPKASTPTKGRSLMRALPYPPHAPQPRSLPALSLCMSVHVYGREGTKQMRNSDPEI